MKKKILCAVLIALLVIGAAVLIIFRQKSPDASPKSGQGQASEEANFDMEYSDRLNGVPVTDVSSNSSSIEVTYGDAGFTRKTLGVVDNSDKRNDLDENGEMTVGAYNVTLLGKNGSIYVAKWSYNSFAYTISLDGNKDGVSREEMQEYILSTR